MEDTKVLSTVASSKGDSVRDFLPLTVCLFASSVLKCLQMITTMLYLKRMLSLYCMGGCETEIIDCNHTCTK